MHAYRNGYSLSPKEKLVETSEVHWTEVEWPGLTSETHYVELDFYKY